MASSLVAIAVALAASPAWAADSERVELESPDGKVKFHLLDAAQLRYQITFRDREVIGPAVLAMIVDGVNLSQGVKLGEVAAYQVDDRYPWRGVHAEAINRCNGAKIEVTHVASGTQYTLEVRAFDDGVAFRHIMPGAGQRVPDEAHEFVIPTGSTIWYHGFRGHYEEVHLKHQIDEIDQGEWSAPPLVIKLPDDAGYAAITEGALIGYSGLGLQATGDRAFAARLGHAQPVSYPFELRFGEEEAKRLAEPAAISGEIVTPWRIVMISGDLNALVNSDVIHNVSPPPDTEIFPQGMHTEWLRPGRSVWKYLDGGEATLEGMQEFSRLAGKLGFEYNLVEGFWRRWSEEELRSLVDYSRERGVGVLLWQHSGRLRTPEERREFFDLCQRTGVAGVKIDFLDHEAKEIIDLYQTLLREAAQHHLIVDFHGANKPAGEARTWPNEMTREAIFGLEMSRLKTRATHNTTLPFTRYLAGHADYTATHFGDRRGETSWAHQIASAAVFTSPLLVYAAHPQNLLDNPAVKMIKSIPSTWDETIVLPSSEIGELAAFARRRGNNWFLAIMNGDESRTIQVPLDFLLTGSHRALLVRDQLNDPAAVKIERILASSDDTLTINLRPGGGFIARFEPE